MKIGPFYFCPPIANDQRLNLISKKGGNSLVVIGLCPTITNKHHLDVSNRTLRKRKLLIEEMKLKPFNFKSYHNEMKRVTKL